MHSSPTDREKDRSYQCLFSGPWYLQPFKIGEVLTDCDISVQEYVFSSGLLDHLHGCECAKHQFAKQREKNVFRRGKGARYSSAPILVKYNFLCIGKSLPVHKPICETERKILIVHGYSKKYSW